MNRQPCAVTAEIQPALKLPYPQAQFAPPRYVPVIRYGEASHAVIVSVDGAVQVSKARPRPTLRTSGAAAAGRTGGVIAGVTVLAARSAAAGEAPSSLLAPSSLVSPDGAAAPPLDGAGSVSRALARIARAGAALSAYEAVTSTPADGTASRST